MDAPVKGMAPNSEKAKALAVALAQIEKQFGKGTIMRLGEGEVIEDIQVVSTGSLGLDIALGVGGLRRVFAIGDVVEDFAVAAEDGGAVSSVVHLPRRVRLQLLLPSFAPLQAFLLFVLNVGLRFQLDQIFSEGHSRLRFRLLKSQQHKVLVHEPLTALHPPFVLFRRGRQDEDLLVGELFNAVFFYTIDL